MPNIKKHYYHVAIIGGGITGASAAHILHEGSEKLRRRQNDGGSSSKVTEIILRVDLFDQGRSGIGGRASHRRRQQVPSSLLNNNTEKDEDADETMMMMMRWDHGCQFFRADTSRFKSLTDLLINEGAVLEWKGNFIKSENDSGGDRVQRDFFGFPLKPPFYVGVGGMQNVSKSIINRILSKDQEEQEGKAFLNVYTKTRVANMERDEMTRKWKLFGTSGVCAFHDTPEKVVLQQQNLSKSNHNESGKNPLGEPDGYDAIILTDISSSFGSWHRASAGVPESFACKVRERVGARVPLFTTMIAFEHETKIPFDAASFDGNNNNNDDDVLWFASKSNSKPGVMNNKYGEESDSRSWTECWTLVSTPEYAMKKIEETPMQDPVTREFIPQSKDYLLNVPGFDLKTAFYKEITSKDGILGEEGALRYSTIPESLHVDAQRWGSALPAPRNLKDCSITRKIISGVAYDSGVSSLAPTAVVDCRHNDKKTFLVDDDFMLFQAGDMVSTLTPGFEGASISGMDAAEYLLDKIRSSFS